MRQFILCGCLLFLCGSSYAATTNTLSAPFICQWANILGGCSDPNAFSIDNANCGPTSVLMVASKYAHTLPTGAQISQMDDWLQAQFGQSWGYSIDNYKGSGTEPPELSALARGFFGLTNSTSFSGWSLSQLQNELASGYPVIVRVRPQMISDYPTAHYMVLLGMDSNFVYVNDPGLAHRGAQKKYPLQDFIDSWARTAQWDGKSNEVVVIHPNQLSTSTWTQKLPGASPSARAGHTTTYDAARSQVVVFGGQGNSGYNNDTWTWDGTIWTQKSPVSSPPARAWQSMAFDAARGQVVMFGGQNGSGNLNDTWVWDGSTWTQKFPALSPSVRGSSVMTYDPAHSQVVLFGGVGFGIANSFNDTWVWDGTSWMQKSPASSPPARFAHTMVYDSARSQVLLFGGTTDYSGPYRNDTWVWDGTTWAQKSPSTNPAPRYYHGMAFDGTSGLAVVFGGYQAVYGLWDDTWTWNGSTWTQAFPSNSPSARATQSMVFDAPHAQVLLFGGANYSTTFGDTWTWKP